MKSSKVLARNKSPGETVYITSGLLNSQQPQSGKEGHTEYQSELCKTIKTIEIGDAERRNFYYRRYVPTFSASNGGLLSNPIYTTDLITNEE
jgi:hypothetical protein